MEKHQLMYIGNLPTIGIISFLFPGAQEVRILELF